MVYDPKKSRAKQKEEDVVDEILKEEKVVTKKATAKKPVAKKPTAKKAQDEKPEAKKPEPTLKIVKNEDELENIHAQDEPLFMQPQVWITLAASALVTLLLIKRRRKK